ncbi:MAG: FtsW/RodA/SpoVE family cell cycle protein [bacterium]|nr:FtsW/RodA/SpoVE family cell cycle protein [bacterium]
METIIIGICKYIICLLVVVYTLYGFTVFRRSKESQAGIFRFQIFLIFAIHAFSFICIFVGMYMDTLENMIKCVVLYLIQVIVFSIFIIAYKLAYKRLSRLVFNNMLMLITFGLIMQTRLKYSSAIKQLLFVTIGLLGCMIIPFIIRKIKYLKEFGWIYGILGLIFLMLVFVIGKEENGAKNWIIIGGFRMQPSEFVKILFVFFVASCLTKAKDFKSVVKITALAALHVIVLVLEKDLGGALIFFIVYLFMLYIATSDIRYLLLGFLGGSMAAVVAYKLFNHVRIRVTAWKDPWSIINGRGYQICQSLFAIGTGGWFGLGLTKGLPTSIPVVGSDFIFSAISEEMGGIVAICIVLICMSCFIMFINISMRIRMEFYKLIALGFSIMYIFQVFLTIGGVTKFIPSTGVTLPLVSSGGSSILSTLIMFNIIQGLYVLNQDDIDQRKLQEAKDARMMRERAQGQPV